MIRILVVANRFEIILQRTKKSYKDHQTTENYVIRGWSTKGKKPFYN